MLMRHAATHPQQIFESDKDRVLTQTGHYQILNIAKQLKEKKYLPDYLLCSPAKRAVQTAQLLCKDLEISQKIIKTNPALYSGDIEAILQSFFLLDSSQHTIIVGHNPTISSLAHKLCLHTKTIILPTAGVVSLSFDIETWENLLDKPAELLFFIQPQID